MNNWLIFAIGSAFFAGVTAILGKVGVKDINSNLATFVRTIVIQPVDPKNPKAWPKIIDGSVELLIVKLNK